MTRNDGLPWYYELKDCWYVWKDGKRKSLSVKGRESRKEATLAYARLFGEKPAEAKPEPAKATLAAVVDGYLADRRGNLKASSYAFLAALLQPFVKVYGELPAESLKPESVLAYRTDLSSSTRCGIVGAICSAYRWADRAALIRSNPMRGVKRPNMRSRGSAAVVSEAAHQAVLAAAKPSLRILLELLKETGARPSELARLKAEQIDFANNVAILMEHKTDENGKARLIFLSPKAVEILKGLAEKQKGILLRNEKGNPWHKDAIGHALRRIRKTTGVKVIAYGYRHTFGTTALAAGIPDSQVAALLGHSGTAMLHKHYSHLTSQSQVLRAALGKMLRGN